MHTNTKRAVQWIAALVFAAMLLFGANAVFRTTAQAASGSAGRTYYAEELKNSELAQKFYRVMEEMAQNGDFDGGVKEYDLAGKETLTQAQIAEYVEGNSPKIPVALGAARDAFYMDHPDLFYIDVYKLYLSAGTQGGKYAAYLGTGDAENYYTDNTVADATEVAAAKAKYEAAVTAAAEAAKAHSDDIVERIRFVNKYIIEKTEYDYGAYENAQNGMEYDGYVNTAYGALVNGKAMCGGFSRAFKAVLDRLDIPCVLIAGSGDSGKSVNGYEKGVEAHMWNAVQIKGLWYAVDVTWNDGAINPERYMLTGDNEFSRNHFPDGVISSSGFELSYPALRPLGYGVDTDENGFTFKDSGKAGRIQFGYSDVDGDNGEKRKSLTLGVSYAGKNAGQLFAEGKYLAFGQTLELGGEMTERWYSPIVTAQSIGMLPADFTPEDLTVVGLVAEEYSIINVSYEEKQIRAAIFGCAPAGSGGVYTPEQLSNANMIAVSAAYGNDAYGTYIPAPYAKRVTPQDNGTVQNYQTRDVTITYSETLVDVNGDPAGDDFAVELAVIGSTSGDLSAYAQIENLRWNASKNMLSFRFTPSKMYQHNLETYSFVPVNMKGAKSGKTPEPAGYYTYKMKQVVCPKIFNDGRLYMQVFGQPKFVSASDESMREFKDANGQPIVGDQRSQLMLVVNEPSKAESDAMSDALLDQTDLTQTDIKASSTYQINLQMCGLVQRVPTGSYMQVGFGFPEGYGPNDTGVTFTVYHYTRNSDGTIDEVREIPCVVTEYGIIATVKSFSPFMICAIDATKASAGKRVFARTSGVGGEVSTGEIVSVASGASHTYTFTADSGYTLESVTLNGTDITEKLQDNRLTLAYDELQANNEVEATFVSERVATARANSGLKVARPRYVVTQDDLIVAAPHETGAAKSHTALIVTLVIVCVIVAAGVTVLAVFFLRKKKNGGNDGDRKKNGKSSANVKAKKEGAKPQPAARPAPKATPQPAAKPRAEASATTARPAARPAQPTARPASATRPAQPTARPASATRPAQPTARPASTTRPAQPTARPASTTRPAQPTARPASTTRPAQPTARPASTTRPASATRPASTTKPSTPKK